MYGRPQSLTTQSTTEMILSLDGSITGIILNNANPTGGVFLMYYADNVGNGDHQFSGLLTVRSGYPIGIDYFECVVPLHHSVP